MVFGITFQALPMGRRPSGPRSKAVIGFWSFFRRTPLPPIRDFNEAISRDPTVAWFFHDRGAARLQSESAPALEDFTYALRLYPEMEWAYRNRATIYERLSQAELGLADQSMADRIKIANS